ncbi:MAG: hypothetical protein RLZ51_532, partial [Pseudomonadota bacterium]
MIVLPTSATSVVFIDHRLARPEILDSRLLASAGFVVINDAKDGLSQIAAALQGVTGLQSVHIVSHGSAGALLLGASRIDENVLRANAGLLTQIGSALAPDGDLLIYGCEVGSGERGMSFIHALARLTGADVAGSSDVTGAKGDWVLEQTTGAINSASLDFADRLGSLAALVGTAGDDSLVGTDQADTLEGLEGADTLAGGEGSDTLTGGLGADTFVVVGSWADTITDFSAGDSISVTGAAFTGEVSSGNGASISQGGFEFYLSGSSTTLYFGL